MSLNVFGQEFLWISGWTVFDKLAVIFLPGTHFMQFLGPIFCSGLKGRRPFWLLNPPSRGVPSLFLLVNSLSGDEEVES